MKRNIIITIDESKIDKEHIHINNMSSIVNYSCDSVTIDCLEYLEETNHHLVLSHLTNKIRLNGKLILKINNSDSICTKFLQKTISNQEFLNFFSNKRSLISVENIYSIIDFKIFDLMDLDISENAIKIVLERKNYE